MRIRVTLLTGALLLASTYAMAQQAQDTQVPQVKTPPGQTQSGDQVVVPEGAFDFGFRGGNFDGDYARFSRYQDYRDKQAGINFKWQREASDYFAKVNAYNVGYYDQEFVGQYINNKVHASFDWNQTPLFYGSSSTLKTPYSSSVSNGTATLLLPSASQQAVQNGTKYTYDKNGFITGATQSANAVGMVTATSLTNGTIYRSAEQGVDVRSRRDDAKFELSYAANRNVDVVFSLNSYSRQGTQPWGASFSFNDAIELPLPVDNRTTDFDGHLEWANQQGMVKVGYEGSIFNNNVTTLVWSNPVRATDSWNGSSYSNALLGGSSLGRMALAPNNHMNTVHAVGMYKLPRHSSFNASLAVSSLTSNDALIPFTINTVMQPGTTLKLSDGSKWTAVAPERATSQADVRLTVGTFNFSTRPNRYFGLTAKYRYSNWDNRTPIFHNPYNVRFDGAPESVPDSANEPANIKHNTFDADATFTPIPYAAFRVGYGHDGQDLTYRMFGSTSENTLRVSFDTIGNQYMTLRAKYENSKRTGSALEEEYFPEAGQQPDMRQYDVANRNRNRATVVFDVTPASMVGFNFSVFRGKDEYPDQSFGLLNNDNTGIGAGIDLTPIDKVTLGFTFDHETYSALQQSRTANPLSATDTTFIDPNRNWNLNTDEKDNTYGVHLELAKLVAKTNIKFGYDYSDSNNAFIYGGQRITDMIDGVSATPGDKPCGAAAAPCFIPLPNATNKLQSAYVDVTYFISPKIGLGANFMHQKYDVKDFSTSGSLGIPMNATYDPIGGLILGYGFRPYNVNVGGFRVIYLF